MSEALVRIVAVSPSQQYEHHGWLHLSCGHRVLYKLPLPAKTDRSSYPCNSCASGQQVLAKGKGAEKDADQDGREQGE